jgi:hypothetical protein
MHIKLSEIQAGREYLEDVSVDGTIILQWMFKKFYSRVRNTRLFIWLKTGTDDELL